MEFERFKASFRKEYKSAEEAKFRLSVFSQRFKIIEKINAGSHNYTLGVNMFTDLTDDELAPRNAANETLEHEFNLTHYRTYLGTLKVNSTRRTNLTVDWVKQGMVTPVKTQGHCNSCWAFATTQALESAWAISTGNLVQLSAQYVVDCNLEESNCVGARPGVQFRVYDWMHSHAVCTEESYGYLGYHGWCHKCNVGIRANAVAGFMVVPHGSETAMMQAVIGQPVSTVIHADPLFPYANGIYDGECKGPPNHGVVLVGYGRDGKVPYWKLKNSWGAAWGEDGYFRLARGVSGEGQCSVLMRASFPVLNASAAVGAWFFPGSPLPLPPGPLPVGNFYGRPPCDLDGEYEISIREGDGPFFNGGTLCAAPFSPGVPTKWCPSPAVGNNATGIWAEANVSNTSISLYCVQNCETDSHCPRGGACFLPPPRNLTQGFCMWPNIVI